MRPCSGCGGKGWRWSNDGHGRLVRDRCPTCLANGLEEVIERWKEQAEVATTTALDASVRLTELQAQLAERDREIRNWKESLSIVDEESAQRRAQCDELRALLVERDKEIERLQASVNEQLARANGRTVAAEAPLAERQFSDAEREMLLNLLSLWASTGSGVAALVESARAKLEQGQ